MSLCGRTHSRCQGAADIDPIRRCRSMAQKESSHKEVVDDLTKQLSQVRKQHEELQVLSRDQV